MPALPTISVLIPSYNQARFLVKTLATIQKQSSPPWEVIVVDGGSTDATPEVVKAYGPLVTKFISERDRGQLDAVGKALSVATGEICYWLNSDDAVMPGAFELVQKTFTRDPSVDIVFSDDYAFDEDRGLLSVGATISNLDFWDHFLFYRQMYSECIFWRRTISEQAFPLDYSLRVFTDYSFFLPLRYGRKCRWLPHRLGAFRMQPAQASQVHREKGAAERESIKERMREKLGLSSEEFRRRQKRHQLSFALRHRVYPKVHSGFRFLRRKLTADVERRRMARFFFNDWLIPPECVRFRLPNLEESPQSNPSLVEEGNG